MIVAAGMSLIGQVIGLFGKKGEAAQAQLKTRIESMDRTWTDEILVVVWFTPVVVAWFDAERSQEWIAGVFSNPEYSALLIGITAAVFGLGKLGRKG